MKIVVVYRDMNDRFHVAEHLSDPQLICEVTRLAASERQAIAALVSALAELDARRLYLGQRCSSMFTYCTQVLHLAEHAAFNRIEAARAARRFPIILDRYEAERCFGLFVRERSISRSSVWMNCCRSTAVG